MVAGLGGLFMVLFDEPAAGVAYLVLGASFLVAWVFYAATGDTRGTELIVLLATGMSHHTRRPPTRRVRADSVNTRSGSSPEACSRLPLSRFRR